MPSHRETSAPTTTVRSSPSPNLPAPSLEQLDGAFDRLPGEVSPKHVPGVEAGLAQGRGGLAPDMEAIDAERDHGLGFREFADPVFDALRIAPNGAFHDFLG